MQQGHGIPAAGQGEDQGRIPIPLKPRVQTGEDPRRKPCGVGPEAQRQAAWVWIWLAIVFNCAEAAAA